MEAKYPVPPPPPRRRVVPITEGRISKGGQNPPPTDKQLANRPPAPGGSGGSATETAEKIVLWLMDQKYEGKDILHSAVCCDFVGHRRFINEIAGIIEEAAIASNQKIDLDGRKFIPNGPTDISKLKE